MASGAALGRGRDLGSLTRSLSLSLPIHVSDTAATSQDGSIFRMQGQRAVPSWVRQKHIFDSHNIVTILLHTLRRSHQEKLCDVGVPDLSHLYTQNQGLMGVKTGKGSGGGTPLNYDHLKLMYLIFWQMLNR